MQNFRSDRKLWIYFLSLCFFLTLVIASFRSSGLDYQSYLEEFKYPQFKLTSEIGYHFLLSAVRITGQFCIVLLIANLTFFVLHRQIVKDLTTFTALLCFAFYSFYIFLFLVLGSPRRLMAFSIIFYLQYRQMKYGNEKDSLSKRVVMLLVATSFHVSSLIAIPLIFWEDISLRKLKIKHFILTCFVIAALIYFLMLNGEMLNYIETKIFYYIYFAPSEQGYLGSVPSLWEGVIKRLISSTLLIIALKGLPYKPYHFKRYLVAELLVYSIAGYFSPVLAVLATFFCISYVAIPILISTEYKISIIRRVLLITSSAIYFIPTGLGLFFLFKDVYLGS